MKFSSGRTDFGKKVLLTLTGFCPFPQEAVRRIWSEWGVPAGLVSATRNCRAEKIIFPLLLIVSTWLSRFFFRLSLSRLNVLHGGRCNSKLSLVRLNYLFSLRTLYYLLEASHCARFR